MSKIYEALRRAELEGTLGFAPYRSPSKNNNRAVTRIDSPGDDHDWGFSPDAPQEIAAAEEAFLFSEIQPSHWQPSFAHLPALEFRGAGVEQFRSLRSRLYEFRVLDGMKSILVTSGLPQEGKSYVAANLAIALARHRENRVLLIDGDMRRPSQHELLGCSSGPGLTEYLSGTAGLDEVLQRPSADRDNPLSAGLMSLAFIAAGHDCDRAADLSLNRRFDELINLMKPAFDWIIVDTSPVNLVSDAVNLARACDGVLLIARSGVTQLDQAKEAASNLKSSKLVGCVLNASQEAPARKDYYGYNGYDPVSPKQ